MKFISYSLLLTLVACAATPTQLPEPKPTAFFLVGDCQGPAFAIAVDDHGNVVVGGGSAHPTDAQKAFLVRAHDQAPDAQRFNIRIGDCVDD